MTFKWGDCLHFEGTKLPVAIEAEEPQEERWRRHLQMQKVTGHGTMSQVSLWGSLHSASPLEGWESWTESSIVFINTTPRAESKPLGFTWTQAHALGIVSCTRYYILFTCFYLNIKIIKQHTEKTDSKSDCISCYCW